MRLAELNGMWWQKTVFKIKTPKKKYKTEEQTGTSKN